MLIVSVVSTPTFYKSFGCRRFIVDVSLDSGVAHASIRARRCDTLHPVSARALHCRVPRGASGGVRGGFLSFLGVVSYRIRILMYRDVSGLYLDCILTCPVHVHQDTSRYIEIHQDTFVSVTLAIIGNVSYQWICILL